MMLDIVIGGDVVLVPALAVVEKKGNSVTLFFYRFVSKTARGKHLKKDRPAQVQGGDNKYVLLSFIEFELFPWK